MTIAQDNTPKQLPNCIREAYLGMKRYRTAIVLDLLLTLGYTEGQWITYQEALNVGADYTAVHIIRDGLKDSTIRRRKLRSRTKGRKKYAYQIPNIERLKRHLVVEWSDVSDTLLLSDFKSGKIYKMALHREVIARGDRENDGDGVVFSRAYLSRRLNVSADTLRRYEKELGIHAEARYQMRQIRDRMDLYHVPDARAHNGMYIEISSRRGAISKLPALRALAGMYLKQGYEIWLRSRLPNRYHPAYPFVDEAQQNANIDMLKNLFAPSGG